MEPGFLHLGWREWLAVGLAAVIIADWAATRYGTPRPRRGPFPAPPQAGADPSATSPPPPAS